MLVNLYLDSVACACQLDSVACACQLDSVACACQLDSVACACQLAKLCNDLAISIQYKSFFLN